MKVGAVRGCVFRRGRIVAALAVERQEHETEHVRRRQERRDRADEPVEEAVLRLDLRDAVLALGGRHDSHVGKTSSIFDIADFSGLSPSEKSRILIPLDLLSKIKFGR